MTTLPPLITLPFAPPPGDQIPDAPFHSLSAEWQEFIKRHLLASPLRSEFKAVSDEEYLGACIDLLSVGVIKVEITDDYMFRISDAGGIAQ